MSVAYPPGGTGFVDVFELFEDATDEMQPGELLFMDGFGLNDAMSAVEIMDDRMDSGVRPSSAPFDSNALLLPEEVCWILDRAFAAEMTWHAGYSLAQTVLTLRYLHVVPRLPSEWFHNPRKDPERRPELITVVLRAGVLALVKSVDLAWREMFKNNIRDNEDWHSEKFEVALCEGMAVATVVDMLDEAIEWLHRAKKFTRQPGDSPRGKVSWYGILIQRLELRKAFLMTLSRTLPAEADDMRSFAMSAQDHLQLLMQGPHPPTPSSTSPARTAFDPYISSTLTVLMPVRVMDVFDDSTAWRWLQGILEGLIEVTDMCTFERLLSWKTFARIQAWSREPEKRSAYLRAISMTAFMSGNFVLGKYQAPWLVDHYFLETGRVPHATLMRLHGHGLIAPPPGASAGVFEQFENDVIACLREFFYSFFHNRARQRRRLTNGLLDMHRYRALAADCARQVRARLGPDSLEASYAKRIELALHGLRLSAVIEVAVSGFELELYGSDEMPFVYWHTAGVLSLYGSVLRETISHLRSQHNDDHSANEFASAELDFVAGLQAAYLGSMLIMRLLPPPRSQQAPDRLRLNMERRFKWAYQPEYANVPIKDQVKPDFDAFLNAPEQGLQGISLMQEALRLFDAAAESFAHVRMRDARETGAELCYEAHQDFLQHLIDVCMANAGFFRIAQTHEDPERRLRWEIKQDQWLQRVVGFSVVESA